MKVSEQFLKAKGLDLKSFMVVRHNGEDYIKLYFTGRPKVGGRRPIKSDEEEEVITPTEIKTVVYGGKPEPARISFYESLYTLAPNHIHTFLRSIKTTSDVSFKVIVNNVSDNYRNVGFTTHQLIGMIDQRQYLLSYYVGPENTASPVHY
jgi:hypothetical protein